MSDELVKKQQKSRRKLAKYQQKINYYAELSNSDISLKKRAAKLCKYRLKIIKRQLKLKRIEAKINQFSAYTKLIPANDGFSAGVNLTNMSNTAGTSHANNSIYTVKHSAQINLYLPYKAKPCQSCPALRGKACLCAMKVQQRKQA
ncbi:hypothetical protein TUM4438_43090 [Shewanella sairae]|uniref:Transposase n=1 Tax=Shewanella sairae TaxID=190310 RepID=A0ABQ4PRE5_9GAMM|nr:hypothetical protein [Shewanella sairae]MCL1128201.1 hypothetical protein [Shewanella sairae]GIU51901.1 hypothetical protein TUM4438_43090 [Shewanella sairae]